VDEKRQLSLGLVRPERRQQSQEQRKRERLDTAGSRTSGSRANLGHEHQPDLGGHQREHEILLGVRCRQQVATRLQRRRLDEEVRDLYVRRGVFETVRFQRFDEPVDERFATELFVRIQGQGSQLRRLFRSLLAIHHDSHPCRRYRSVRVDVSPCESCVFSAFKSSKLELRDCERDHCVSVLASAPAQERQTDELLDLVHSERQLAFGRMVQQVCTDDAGQSQGVQSERQPDVVDVARRFATRPALHRLREGGLRGGPRQSDLSDQNQHEEHESHRAARIARQHPVQPQSRYRGGRVRRTQLSCRSFRYYHGRNGISCVSSFLH
jgi:hypothetical protein